MDCVERRGEKGLKVTADDLMGLGFGSESKCDPETSDGLCLRTKRVVDWRARGATKKPIRAVVCVGTWRETNIELNTSHGVERGWKGNQNSLMKV